MKVVKIAAIVVGAVALAATGIGLAMGAGTLAAAFGAGLGAIGLGSVVGAVGLGTLGTIALGALAIDLSMIAGALAPKPSAGGNQTKWKADPYAGIPYVMGRTLVGGNLVLKRGHGANYKWLTAVTVLGLGPFQSIDATFMDKTAVSFNGSGAAIGTYAGQIWQRTQLGACPEPAALTSPRGNPTGWTSAHKLSGLAAAINTFEYDGKSENGLTSVPPPSWIVKGALVYDPRLDSTYPGGSGACRAWNEATYVWSEDPHLHGLTWALGRYQNGVRVAGIGAGTPVPGGAVTGIDVASFVEGANLNDARGWKLGGQVYTRPDTPWNSLKAMLQAGGARPVLVGGVISCVNSAPKVSLATITRDDIAGATEFSGTQRKRQRINAIIPQYRSEQHDWEVVSATRVSVAAFETLDGDERTREIAWPLVQQVSQVSQLAALAIYDLREAGPGTVALKPWWLNYRIGDCVTFAPEDGFALKCAITGRGLDAQTGAVSVTLRGETDGKHDYALGLTGTAPPIASLNYVETVDAPTAAEWTLTGTELSANGTTVPALIVSGACDNPAAEAVIVEYRLHSPGQADGAGWLGASTEAPTLTRKEITSVTTATAYDVAVRYRVRGKLGPRLILGPETTSDFTAPGTVGPPGASAFTLTNLANVTTGPDWIEKVSGDNDAWDASGIATPSFTGGCVASFRFPAAQAQFAGIDSFPSEDNNYTSIDCAFHVEEDGDIYAFASGSGVALPSAHDPANLYQCYYDNESLRWLINGALVHSIPTTPGRTFWFDSSLIRIGSKVADISWAAAGAKGASGEQGPAGAQGIQGPAGPNGDPTYIWIAYADSSDGLLNFTNGAPGSRTYLGVAPNKATQAESSDPADYAWSKIEGPQGPTGSTGGQGPQGIQGPAGPNGDPTYIWIAYADSSDGTVNFTNGAPGSRTYLGVAPNKATQTESSNPADYAWSKIEGPQGPTGSTGGQGPEGPQGPQGPSGITAPQPVQLTSPSGQIGPLLVEAGSSLSAEASVGVQATGSGTATAQLKVSVNSGGFTNFGTPGSEFVGPGEPATLFASGSYTNTTGAKAFVTIQLATTGPSGLSVNASNVNYLSVS